MCSLKSLRGVQRWQRPPTTPFPKLQNSESVGGSAQVCKETVSAQSLGSSFCLAFFPWAFQGHYCSKLSILDCCTPSHHVLFGPPTPRSTSLASHGPVELSFLRVPGQVASVPCWVGMKSRV